MKKCKWCEAKIEDNVTICPYCKTNQNIDYSDGVKVNHFENYSNGNSQQNPLYDDIHQIAGDLRFIKNLIILSIVCGVVFGIISMVLM